MSTKRGVEVNTGKAVWTGMVVLWVQVLGLWMEWRWGTLCTSVAGQRSR